MKPSISFNAESYAEIIPFDSMESLASITAPYLRKGTIGLSGGQTFAALFPLWAKIPGDYGASSFFPVDERIVPFSDPKSNWGNAYESFLKPIGKGTDLSHVAISKEGYQAILFSHFNQKIPIFDVIFLGVGDDGHTASLFPNEPYLDDLNSPVLQTASPKPRFERITLGMAPLIAARRLIVIIAGREKKNMVTRIFERDQSMPIVKVLSRRNTSSVFIYRQLLEDE